MGVSKDQSFDLESSVADGLIIATKFGESWYSLEVALASGKVNNVMIDKHLFSRATQNIIEAIRNYYWVEAANYLSHTLTLSFVVVLIWRVKKYGFWK